MDLFNHNRVNQQSYYEEGALLHPGRMQAPPMAQSPRIGFMQNSSVDLRKQILHESRTLKQDGESTYSTGNTGNNSCMMERSNEDRDSFNMPFARKQINQLADKEAYLPLSERLSGKSYGSSAEKNIPPENSIDYKFQSNLLDDPERKVCVTFLNDEPLSSLDIRELLDVFADLGLDVSGLEMTEDSKLACICFEHVDAASDAISVMNNTSLNTGGPILQVEQFSKSKAMHAANKSLFLDNAYSRGLSPVSSHSSVRSNRSPAVTESRGHSPPFADTRHHSPRFDGLQVAMHSRSPIPIGDEKRGIGGATILVSSMNVNDTHLLPKYVDMKKYFKFYGRIRKMVMGEYPPHAYITYSSKLAAEKAISGRNRHRMQGGRVMKAFRAVTWSDHLNIENDVSKRDMREERRSPVREERLGSFPRMSKEREQVRSSKEVRMRLGGGKGSRRNFLRKDRKRRSNALKRDRTPEIRHEEKCRNGEDKIEPEKASNSIDKLEKLVEIRADIASAKTIASLCPINLQKRPAFDSHERFGLEHVEEMTTFYCKPCDYKVSTGRIDFHCKLRSHYDSTLFMLKEQSGRVPTRENRTSFLTNQVQMRQMRGQRKTTEQNERAGSDRINISEEENSEIDFPLEVLSDAGSYQEE